MKFIARPEARTALFAAALFAAPANALAEPMITKHLAQAHHTQDWVYPDAEHQLADKDPQVRLKAIRALSRIDSPRAIRLLTGAISDAESQVRLEAVFALAQKKGSLNISDPTPALVDRMPLEKDPAVRAAIVRALGCIAGKLAIETLVHARDDDPDPGVRTAAESAISYIYGR